jgi:hypothetical protein
MELLACLGMETHPLIIRKNGYQLGMDRDSFFQKSHQELMALGKRRDLSPATTKTVATMLEIYAEVEAGKSWEAGHEYTTRQYRLSCKEKLLGNLLAKEQENVGVLADFLGQHSDSRLLIVCDRKPSFKKLRPDAWEFAHWSMAREVAQVQEMNVGLMPLQDSEFARGKCGFKMLSYMAVGLPVIVSPFKRPELRVRIPTAAAATTLPTGPL